MASVPYVGKPSSVDVELITRDYVGVVKAADLTTGAIDTLINSGLSGYATKSYVDAQDALLATQSYIDTQDNLRVKLAQKDVANGVPGLDANGKVNPSRINLVSTQGYNRGPWSPAAYNASPVTATTETTLFTCPVTDPGYAYKLLVFGMVDVRSSLTTEYPIINVRVGSTSGPIIANAFSLQDSYSLPGIYGDDFNTGTTLDSSKWGTVSTTGKPLPTISGGAMQLTPFGSCAQWIGAQPDVDSVALTFKVAASGIGFAGVTTFYLSGNSGWTQWVGLICNRGGGGGTVSFVRGTNSNLTGGTQVATYNLAASEPTFDTATYKFEYDTSDNTYRFFGRTGTNYMSWTDTSNTVPHGVGKRRWAVYNGSDGANSPFHGPFTIDDLRVTEVASNIMYSSARVIPTVSQAVKTGATTLYVRAARSGASATITASATQPKLFVLAVPA